MKKVAIGLTIFVVIVMIGAALDGGPYTSSPAVPARQDVFQDLAKARFDELASAWTTELESIECLDGDCTSVVYFNFSALPSDLDLVIRGNAATFSKFKLDNTGTSHVTLFATHNGQVVMACDASKGMVSECRK